MCYNQAMSKTTVDTWFFSDSRFKDLVSDERLAILLIATDPRSTIGTISTRSGFVQGTVKQLVNRLLKVELITQTDEFFHIATKSGEKSKEVVLRPAQNEEYLGVIEHLYKIINETAPANGKKLTSKSSDYKAIQLMVENDKVSVEQIHGILNIYLNIPFWGEKFIVQSALGLRKHWLKIYQSAEKHYTKTRVEKI